MVKRDTTGVVCGTLFCGLSLLRSCMELQSYTGGFFRSSVRGLEELQLTPCLFASCAFSQSVTNTAGYLLESSVDQSALTSMMHP